MKHIIFKLFGLAIIIVAVVEAFNLSRPLPVFGASVSKLQATAASAAALPWPASGQAAIGTETDGVLETHGPQTPVPIASISKVIAALAVLQKYPLSTTQQGPVITLGQQDVDSFNYYYTHDGSVAQVAAGEKISEYQALEAMMLPSADNIADSLTNWAFGSSGAYIDYANQMVKNMGLKNTTVGEASGFFDRTLSTASDLVTLGQAVLNNPVLSNIVDEGQANIPVAGTVRNVNWLLGENGVVGIKTGNTDKAGGCFLFAAKNTLHDQNVTLVGAVLGDTTLNEALINSAKLIVYSSADFRTVNITKGQVVGHYTSPWGQTTAAVAQKSASFLIWRGRQLSLNPQLKNISSVAAGVNVGTIKVTAGNKIITIPIVTNSAISKPSLWWRLRHF